MIKNNKFVAWLGAFAFVAGVQIATPEASQAGVAVGSDGKLVLSGDVRFRYEVDDRDTFAAPGSPSVETNRDRIRLRARFGGIYTVDENWSAGFRLATASSSLNTPHQTFGFVNGVGNNASFGLDRAYIKYKWEGLSVWGGKNGLNFWQQNEAFWDADTQPTGLAATYKYDPITVNAGFFLANEGNWNGASNRNDLRVFTYQAVGQHKLDTMGGVKLTAAIGGASIGGDVNRSETVLTVDVANPPGILTNTVRTSGPFQSETYFIASLQAKGSDWLIGGDYLTGDASVEDTGYVVQARYTVPVGNGLGLRVYYYHIEAFSVPGDGMLSQDNFPNPGDTGVSNFEGWRFQAGYKITDHVSADLRYYMAEAIINKNATDVATKAAFDASPSDAIMSKDTHNRFQVNVNVKF